MYCVNQPLSSGWAAVACATASRVVSPTKSSCPAIQMHLSAVLVADLQDVRLQPGAVLIELLALFSCGSDFLRSVRVVKLHHNAIFFHFDLLCDHSIMKTSRDQSTTMTGAGGKKGRSPITGLGQQAVRRQRQRHGRDRSGWQHHLDAIRNTMHGRRRSCGCERKGANQGRAGYLRRGTQSRELQTLYLSAPAARQALTQTSRILPGLADQVADFPGAVAHLAGSLALHQVARKSQFFVPLALLSPLIRGPPAVILPQVKLDLILSGINVVLGALGPAKSPRTTGSEGLADQIADFAGAVAHLAGGLALHLRAGDRSARPSSPAAPAWG